MTQLSMFGPDRQEPEPKPVSDTTVRLRMMVTVKAAPNPSQRYGETVCVAGISIDPARPGWIRLYPINYRELASDDTFRKYDIITLDAKPARPDPRAESYKPLIDTMVNERHLRPWNPRRPWLDEYIEDSMCRLNRLARTTTNAPSLALIRPRTIDGIDIEAHPGWTPDEQRKIDAYVNQLDLFNDQDRTPLQAPRFKAAYRYHCHDTGCHGHRQGIIDWELVAPQRRLTHLPDHDLRDAIRATFLTRLCAPDRDTAFYVGNQAKRPQTFSVLGIYWPPHH